MLEWIIRFRAFAEFIEFPFHFSETPQVYNDQITEENYSYPMKESWFHLFFVENFKKRTAISLSLCTLKTVISK